MPISPSGETQAGRTLSYPGGLLRCSCSFPCTIIVYLDDAKAEGHVSYFVGFGVVCVCLLFAFELQRL